MKKFERLEETVSPDGTVLTLYRHDGAYFMRAHGEELMSTRRHHSERELGDLACAGLRDVRSARVLVGGLGFGFTLRSALGALAADASVVVAELLGDVIAWNRNRDYALAGDALDDPRVTVLHADVSKVLRASRGQFDAIMLDVDNGADAFTTRGNATLYREAGIAMTTDALTPSGRVAYWSATDDAAFEHALRTVGMHVTAVRSRVHASSRVTHTIFVAEREAIGPSHRR